MSASTKSMTNVKEARELYDLKERAAKFYDENGVPQKMEEILNSMFYENPADVYGHLANYFQGYSKTPTITKVRARTAIDGKGQASIQTDIFCTVNNKEKLVSSTLSSSTTPSLLEIAKAEELEEEMKERENNVAAAIQLINTEVCTKLNGQDPSKQEELDTLVSEIIAKLKAAEEEKLALEAEQTEGTEETKDSDKKPTSSVSKSDKPKSGKNENRAVSKMGADTTTTTGGKGGKGGAPVVVVPDEPKENMICGSCCMSAASQAICVAGARTTDSPLFEYIGALRCGQTPKKFRMPLPMVTIFQSGRSAPGKSCCIKEYMLVPAPGKPLCETIPQIVAVYNDIVKSIVNKNGVAAKNVTDIGALMMPFDRPEQGLDLIQESMGRLGLTPGEDMYMALNLAGHEIFDYDTGGSKEKASQSFPFADKKQPEKGKYEVITGQQKLAEDMVDFWAEFLGRYPAVIAVIDPLRKQEDKQWMALCEKISEKCYILGDKVWHRPGLLKDEEITENFTSSGVIYKLEQMNTVSDVIKCAKKMEENANETVLSTNIGETSDDFIADMAVGINARFLKIGAPCRGERISKLNRLVSIEVALKDSDRLLPHGEFKFPTITVPPPPEGEEVEGEDAEPKESSRKK
ncbi:enolase 4-like isoform X2 [Ruditapes philippinarum]|uniref:enolase 4-like isoform X2 n=1 Tax=Ruditapes philippinarum TaxID=129788 RepID=UPI00295BB4CA|nr:enolase 4-like isoform X2 [Ruditapes philippinarum]